MQGDTMSRPRQPIYLREDGIFYARVNGHRWSTETTDINEAAKRLQFMKIKKKPWKEIKNVFNDRVEIVIDEEGNTHAKVIQYYSEPDLAIRALPKVSDNNSNFSEPLKDCVDINVLLDYELKLRRNKLQGTVDYYKDRFDALKRYVKKENLNLNTFTKTMAMKYPVCRLGETINVGQVGFNNRPAGVATVNKEISLFKGIWSVWKEEGRVSENVWMRVEKIKAETGDVDEFEPQTYTIKEVALILKNIENETIRNVCIFQAVIGSRPGLEVLRLNKEMLEKNKIWSSKKRRWDNLFYSEEAKDHFYKNLDGKMDSLNSSKIHKAFVNACQKAGVRVGKPYDLRKVFATEALMVNRIETVQKLMRHCNLHTTRKSYAETRNTETKAAAESMQKKIIGELQQ